MKLKIVAMLIAIACSSTVFAEGYKVTNIIYTIEGKTKEYALDRNLDINKHKVFATKDDFDVFLEDLKKRLDSNRIFKETSVEATFEDASEDGIIPVTLSISAKDTKNRIFLPYPKYKSDDGKFPSGGSAYLKVKDYNFLGLMNTLTMALSVELETENEGEPMDKTFGLSFDYDLPFSVDPFKLTWENDFSIDYTIGDSAPEYDITTGFDIKLPFDIFALDLELKQSVARNEDYIEYGDAIYFTEFEKFSIPITVGEIENWGKVTYSPFISATQYWDKDGISIDNESLRGLETKFGHTISSSRIDWNGNFRNGASVSVEQSYIYNSYNRALTPYYEGELKIFLASKYAGLAMRFLTFQNVQTYSNSGMTGKKIGDELRGIRDSQKFDNDYWTDGEENEVYKASPYALKTPAALIFNFDFPIKVFTTDWMSLREKIITGFFMPVFHTSDDPLIMKPFKILKDLDFELQFSPFVDVGLTYNRATKKQYSLRDGFYAGGLEMLVYPAKFRSIVVRTSFGVDIGRKIFKNKLDLDTDWRRTSTSTWEAYIGLGLHY